MSLSPSKESNGKPNCVGLLDVMPQPRETQKQGLRPTMHDSASSGPLREPAAGEWCHVDQGRSQDRTGKNQFLCHSQESAPASPYPYTHPHPHALSFLPLPPFILILFSLRPDSFPFLLPSSCLCCLLFNITCSMLIHKRAGNWQEAQKP